VPRSQSHVIGIQLLPNLRNRFGGVFVDHGGGACDDTQTFGAKLAQIRDCLLRQTIAQEFLLGVVAQILTRSQGQALSAAAIALCGCHRIIKNDRGSHNYVISITYTERTPNP
jgi:hypothetical protein